MSISSLSSMSNLYRYATVSEPLHCVYKFDYDKYSGTFDIEDDNSPVGEVNRHKFYGWHTATLILLALALLTSFLAVCVGMCGCCYPSLSLMFTVITLLTSECRGRPSDVPFAAFLSSVAVGLFFFFSHRADNRFIKGIVGTYEVSREHLLDPRSLFSSASAWPSSCRWPPVCSTSWPSLWPCSTPTCPSRARALSWSVTACPAPRTPT